jgi:hypothetical protein
MRSTVAAALLLSFTAPPLTAWMRVRCFRVVGDCSRRRVREGAREVDGGDGDEDEDDALVEDAAGVERAM